jgi:hypothetical protein
VSLPAAEAELYDALLGPVDFTVPTPAVVRDGHLAPYQELAWLTEPLTAERAWLSEHDTRFRELVTALHDDAESEISFPAWVMARIRDRRRSADDDAEVPWAAFQKRSPALARAGVRFLLSGGLALPPGAPRGEAYRRAPDLDDWLVLLEDYALRCLAPLGLPSAADRYDAIAAALRELGFQLTRTGIRRGEKFWHDRCPQHKQDEHSAHRPSCPDHTGGVTPPALHSNAHVFVPFFVRWALLPS